MSRRGNRCSLLHVNCYLSDMTPRRQQTMYPATQQPVRFYKFIAITFLLITVLLLGFILFMSSKRAVITIETKPSSIDVQGQTTLSSSDRNGHLPGMVSTTVVTVEQEFTPTGTREEEGTATGVVMLHNDSGVSQPLVATTRLLSPDDVLFRLKDRVVVPANGTVEAAVFADQTGKESDIGPTKFTIPGLSAARQKQVYAKSDAAMRGGVSEVGAVSKEDVDAAEKQLLTALQKQGETVLADAHEGQSGTYLVVQHTVENDAAVGDEVSTFTLTGKATVLGAFYDEETMQQWAQSILMKRALNDAEIVEPSEQAATIKITDYDLTRDEVDVDAFFTGVAMLNPESKQLQKSMFFGKTKDEVRRYVLSLDHVRGVDVSFQPAWMMSVPHIADHVTVIVKSVE